MHGLTLASHCMLAILFGVDTQYEFNSGFVSFCTAVDFNLICIVSQHGLYTRADFPWPNVRITGIGAGLNCCMAGGEFAIRKYWVCGVFPWHLVRVSLSFSWSLGHAMVGWKGPWIGFQSRCLIFHQLSEFSQPVRSSFCRDSLEWN